MAANFPYKVFNDLAAKLKAAKEETKAAKAEIQFLQNIRTVKDDLNARVEDLDTKVEDLTMNEEKPMLLNTSLCNLSLIHI